MAKTLENLDYSCKWVSELGCIKGCLDHLGIKASDAWVYGASGHAFIINMHDEMCPSGPTAWNSEGMLELVENIGCKIEGMHSHKRAPDFADAKTKAWEFTRQAIDSGYPCFGWELAIPEYYVVYGYDDEHYLFKGPAMNPETKPRHWQELGDAETGVLYMSQVKPAEAKDDAVVIKEALSFAVEHARDPKKWTFPKYMTGLEAFDSWIKALGSEEASGFGAAYNAEVWHECRHLAVEFLKEAKERLAKPELDPLFDEATGHYEVVRKNLKEVAEVFPFLSFDPAHIKDASRREKAAAALKLARDAEAKGLEALEAIAKAL
jgi:hypothetical protein